MRPVRFTSSPSLIFWKISEKHDTDLVFFKIERQAADAVRELQQLAGHYFFQTVYLGDTVADFDHGTDFVDLHDSYQNFRSGHE